MKFKQPWLYALTTLLALSAQAQSDERSGTVEIRTKAENLMGTASASSEGLVSAGRIAEIGRAHV